MIGLTRSVLVTARDQKVFLLKQLPVIVIQKDADKLEAIFADSTRGTLFNTPLLDADIDDIAHEIGKV